MFMKLRKVKKLNTRGFTIVELTMVMAIASIIAVMIVSFSVLISAQVKKNNLRADFMQATVDFRNDLQKEWGKIDGSENLIFEVNNPEKHIKFEDSEALPFEWASYEYIDEVSIERQEKIIKITVLNKQLGESERQSFVLISKVG